MILTLITVGKMLEAHSKGKTTNALKGLMNLSPKTAVLLRNGEEVTVPVEQVHRGEQFVVRPGESIPVDKSEGSTVSAGTLNSSGFIRCEARRVGEDTTLSQIIAMVSDAAATKAPIAKMADRVSGVFVPAVISIAGALLFDDISTITKIQPEAWAVVIYLAITCTCLAYFLQNAALKFLSSSLVSMLQCTQPILTAAASYFLLNEKLTFTGMSGAVIILACIISENILEKK